jgi:hypothetical protein
MAMEEFLVHLAGFVLLAIPVLAIVAGSCVRARGLDWA